MAWFALHSLAALALAFGVGVTVGWLLRAQRGRGPGTPRPDEVPAALSPVPADAILARDDGPGVTTRAAAAAHTDPTEPTKSIRTIDRPSGPVAKPATEAMGTAPTDRGAIGGDGISSDLRGAADVAGATDQTPEPDAGTAEPDAGTAEPDGSGSSDDLTRIEGISPQMAAALAAEGLGSFAAVARSDEDTLRRALRINRIRSAPGITTWCDQARALQGAPQTQTPEPADGPDHDTGHADTGHADTGHTDTERAAWSKHPDAQVLTEPLDLGEIARAAKPDGTATPDVVSESVDQPDTDQPDTDQPDTDPLATMPAEELDADPAVVTAEEEPSPLVEAMAALDRREAEARVRADRGVGPQGTRPDATPAITVSRAFRTARGAGPSWTTIAPADPEDLERIIGLTRSMVVALREAGVTNYTQLAAVRDEELRGILADAGLEAPPTLPTWSVQAALLLQGDAESAATLVGGLMVGRETP